MVEINKASNGVSDIYPLVQFSISSLTIRCSTDALSSESSIAFLVR